MKRGLLVLSFVFFITGYIWLVLLSKSSLPLMSYDEAWYASIAHNMVANNSWMGMSFNGSPYYDHPPLGFWIMAVFMKTFGETELMIRLPSMIAAVSSLLLLFLLAKERANRRIAIIPPLMLGSSLWYIYRARSADLDSMLVFFFISVVYATEQLSNTSRKWLWTILTGLALAGLVMIKTLVGLGILPVLGVILITSKKDKLKNLGLFLMASILALGLCLPWYNYSQSQFDGFLKYHFMTIGTRAGSNQKINLGEFKETLLYFRSGVGKWYYPAIGSFFISLGLLGFKKFRNRYVVIDLVWLSGVGIPFLLSPKTEVWHLIPLYPPLFLLSIQVLVAASKIISLKYVRKIELAAVLIVLVIAIMQIKSIMPLLFQSIEFDRKDISLKARRVQAPVAMKAAFLPAFVYYSQKEDVKSLWLEQKSYNIMKECLLAPECNQAFVIEYSDYQLLTKDELAVSIEASNSSYLIVSSLKQ